MTEVIENRDTLKCAWDWAEKKGLITFTWHWFSPLGGRSKAFPNFFWIIAKFFCRVRLWLCEDNVGAFP